MKNYTRLAVLLLAALLFICPVLSGCGNKDKNNIREDECVLTAAGAEISYGLYRYFFLNYKAGYSAEDISADPDRVYKEITEDTLESLRDVYAVVSMCSEYGISTSDKDIEEMVDATIVNIREQYIDEEYDKTGIKGYKQQLADNFMTEEVLRFVLSVDYAEERLFIKMTGEGGVIPSDDDTVRRAIDSEFIRVLQVYINTADNGKTYEESKALAEKIAKEAKAGGDFDALVANNSNDYTMTRDGYYMPRGWMDERFEDVAFSLEIGETSDVLELGDGFHIIKRYECEDEYIEKNYEQLKERYLTCKFYEKIDARAQNVTVTETALYSSIKPENIALG